MRYLDGQVPGAAEHAGTPEFVGFTVFLTLMIGIIFVVADAVALGDEIQYFEFLGR